MRNLKWLVALCAVCLAASTSLATPASLSFQGTLASPTDVFELTFTVGGSGGQTIDIQTWGFGGGTNAAGQTISLGGFDPMISLFRGSGDSAAIVLTDYTTNGAGTQVLSETFNFVATATSATTNTLGPAASADTLITGGGASMGGLCPPGHTVNIGTGAGAAVCGDATLNISNLPTGTYTLVLSDANYFPNAVNPGPPELPNGAYTLGEGFGDLTGGVFQTCNSANGVCITPNSAWAFDITDATVGGTLAQNVPEPGELLQLGISALFLLGGVGLWRLRYGELRE